MYHIQIIIMSLLGVLGGKSLQYAEFDKWVDTTLSTELPDEIEAFCFNLYDDGNGDWSAEIIGAGSFDKDDSDWACNEVFDNRDNPIQWKSDESWEKQLSSFRSLLERYLKKGKYASLLKEKKGLGFGFVDGDMILVPTE